MTEKIIDFQEGLKKTLEITVIKKKNEIKLSGKRGCLKIYLNPYVEKKQKSKWKFLEKFKKCIWKVLNKNTVNSKSVREITKEECKMMLFNNFKRISPIVFGKVKEEALEKIHCEIWEKIENEIINSESLFYELIIGKINRSKDPFTYAVSEIFLLSNKNAKKE